jgi:hypothetical protein
MLLPLLLRFRIPYRSSPKEAEVLSEVMARMGTYEFCRRQRKPFTEQSEWLATVKKDPAAAAALLDQHLGIAGGGSSGSSSSRSAAVARALKNRSRCPTGFTREVSRMM